MQNKCIAIIPARGGSKRIPKKNIKDFHGKPLIAYSIEVALKSKLFDKVIVSTDDKEIAEIAKKYGAQVPFIRPKELSDDFTGTGAVVNHVLEYIKSMGENYDYFCTIYATAPLLQEKYLIKGFEELKNSNAKIAFSCTSMPFPIQRTFKITDNRRCEMFWPENFKKRSQDFEESFQDAGQFYFENVNVTSSEITFGKDSIPIILPRYLVQDIDTYEDWDRAEIMYEVIQRKKVTNKIQVITEGGKKFGFGHISRTTSLVQEFEGFDIEFIIEGDESIFNILSRENTKIFNWHKKENELLQNLDGTILIIDSLNLHQDLLEKIEKLNIPIILFDDEKRNNFLNKGYVIDWTILSDEKNFFLPRKENVKYFIGSQYTSLRKSFLLTTPVKLNKDIKKIIVSFGGSDVRNLTPKILKFLCSNYPNIEKNIVIGPGFDNIEEIKVLKDEKTNFLYNLNENEMCQHMQNSDIAISAGGQTLYELARLGIPTIAPLLIENARDDTLGWKDIGFIRYIGLYDDEKLLVNLAKEMNYLQSFMIRKEIQKKTIKYINLDRSSKIVTEVMKDLYGAI